MEYAILALSLISAALTVALFIALTRNTGLRTPHNRAYAKVLSDAQPRYR